MVDLDTPCEVAVVGRGLVGSAAARHLAESGVSVVLIGPGEPPDRRRSRGPFASHHDQGRITRIADDDALWARMAAESIARYRDVEKRSGIRFHHPSGLVLVPDDPETWVERSIEHGGRAQVFDSAWLRRTTGIAADPDAIVIHEPAPSGAIDPLALVAAQTELVGRAGGRVVDAAATAVDGEAGRWRVEGSFGTVIAARLLLATGAFGSGLLPRPLDLARRPRTVFMAELVDWDRDPLPALIHDGPFDSALAGIYWTPPVAYPDGRHYLKIGGDMLPRVEMTEPELTPWFHGDGDPNEIAALADVLAGLLPDATIGETWSKPCATVNTPSGYPYVGWVAEGMAVAIGGNGAAAKSSDEIGRLAASLFADPGWDESYDPEAFIPALVL